MVYLFQSFAVVNQKRILGRYQQAVVIRKYEPCFQRLAVSVHYFQRVLPHVVVAKPFGSAYPDSVLLVGRLEKDILSVVAHRGGEVVSPYSLSVVAEQSGGSAYP